MGQNRKTHRIYVSCKQTGERDCTSACPHCRHCIALLTDKGLAPKSSFRSGRSRQYVVGRLKNPDIGAIIYFSTN